jgi:hypothetical protein
MQQETLLEKVALKKDKAHTHYPVDKKNCDMLNPPMMYNEKHEVI